MQLHFTLPHPFTNELSSEPCICRLPQLANNFPWSEILMKNYIELLWKNCKVAILKKMNLFLFLFVLFILVHLISTSSKSDCCTNSCCFLEKTVTIMMVTKLCWWHIDGDMMGSLIRLLFNMIHVARHMSPILIDSKISHQHKPNHKVNAWKDEVPFYHVCQEWLLLRHNQQLLQRQRQLDLKLFYWNHYWIFEIDKVGSVSPMVISSEFHMRQYWDDDHR